MTLSFTTLAVAAGIGMGLAGFGVQAFSAPPMPAPLAAPYATPDQATIDALTFSREEERMARDLYAALAARYDNARPFSMITQSEQQHFGAIGTLLNRYGITDPSAGKAAGTYADADLQTLYDGWLAQGTTSLAEAYKVGIALEERDIADLKGLIAGTLPDDVDAVLGNLLKGSENHLAAFTNAPNGTLGSGPVNGNGPGNGSPDGRRGPGAGSCDGTCDGSGAQGPRGDGTCTVTGQPGASNPSAGPMTGNGRRGR